MSDAYVMSDPTTGKMYDVCGSAKVKIAPLVFDAMMETFEGDNNRLIAENTRLREVVADGNMHAREILAENAKLRELTSRAWGLFLKHGAVHPCDLPEVDAVRGELRELGVGVTADD